MRPSCESGRTRALSGQRFVLDRTLTVPLIIINRPGPCLMLSTRGRAFRLTTDIFNSEVGGRKTARTIKAKRTASGCSGCC
jgi:hypothetical protein